MATIKEDYVSFEIAKLLKEKGFDIGVRYYYQKIDDDITYHIGDFRNWNVHDMWYSMPTQQMAMKWLREVHKVNIEIPYNRFGENYKYLIIYKPEVLDDIRSLGVFYHYEDAVEEAIKYCLENLI